MPTKLMNVSSGWVMERDTEHKKSVEEYTVVWSAADQRYHTIEV